MNNETSILELSQKISDIKSKLDASGSRRIENRTEEENYDEEEYWQDKLTEARKVEAASNSSLGYDENLEDLPKGSFEWLDKAEEFGEIEVRYKLREGRLAQHKEDIGVEIYESIEDLQERGMPQGLIFQVIERGEYADRLLIENAGTTYAMAYDTIDHKPKFESLGELAKFAGIAEN